MQTDINGTTTTTTTTIKTRMNDTNEFRRPVRGEENAGYVIRRAKSSDCKEIRRLHMELTKYQKIKGKGEHISAETLEKDGFGTNPPLYRAFVAHLPGDEKLIGYAMYCDKYSSSKGKSMLLEDLYCAADYREKHVGSALFRAVVKEAAETGYQRMDWEVLEWNPAKKFYDRFGGCDITERDSWHLYRLERGDLERISGQV